MAAITEASLQGEWFYLEEDEPLDRASPEFSILRDGKVQSSTKPDVSREYVVTDDAQSSPSRGAAPPGGQ